MQDAVNEVKVRYIVPFIYIHFLLPPYFMTQRFRNKYNTTWNPTEGNIKVNQIYVPKYVPREGVIMEGYRRTRARIGTNDSVGVPLPEYKPGLQP